MYNSKLHEAFLQSVVSRLLTNGLKHTYCNLVLIVQPIDNIKKHRTRYHYAIYDISPNQRTLK